MACGKTVFLLLAIVASISCAPTEKDSSSREENVPPEREPPPYHQSPLNDNQGHQNSHHGQHDSCEQLHKAEAQGHEASSGFPNIGSSRKENSLPKIELPLSPCNYNEEYHESRENQGILDNSSSLPNFGLPKFYGHHDKAELFGIDSNSGLQNFSQLLSSLSGSRGSSPLNQHFQDPFQQLINAFGVFIPGLGGSNSSGLPNLFSGFMPHSSRSQLIDLPGDVAAENRTEDQSPHDRIFFSLFHNFVQNFFQNSANRDVTIGCNYTTQAGYSCSGCREQLLCDTNNVGRIRICPRSAPYCYNGVCGSVVNTTACTTTTTG